MEQCPSRRWRPHWFLGFQKTRHFHRVNDCPFAAGTAAYDRHLEFSTGAGRWQVWIHGFLEDSCTFFFLLLFFNYSIFSPLIFQSKYHNHHTLCDSKVSLKEKKERKRTFIFSFCVILCRILTASVWMGCTAKNSAVTKASRQSLNTALSQVYISTRVTRQCKITFTAWK